MDRPPSPSRQQTPPIEPQSRPLSPRANPPSTPPPHSSRRSPSSGSRAIAGNGRDRVEQFPPRSPFRRGGRPLLKQRITPTAVTDSGVERDVSRTRRRGGRERSLQRLLASVAPLQVEDLVWQSVEDNSPGSRQADAALRSYRESRDSATLLELLDGIGDASPHRSEPRGVFSNTAALGSFESLARTDASDFSFSRFPWPPSTPAAAAPPSAVSAQPSPSRSPRSQLQLSGLLRRRTTSERSSGRVPDSPTSSKGPRPARRRASTGQACSDHPPVELENMAPSPGASLLLDSPSTDRGTKASTPQRAIFEDLPTAHSSITNAQRQKGVLDGRPGSSAAAATAPVGAPAPKQFAAALDYPDQLPSPSVPNADSSMVMTPESESTPAAVVSAKPVPSSGWMGKLSNVFQRRGDSPDTPESADRVSFKNSRSSQSNPHLGRVAPNYLDHHPRLSVSAKQISSHHHQTSSSSQYSQPGAASASVHTGLARMHAMSVDDASEYSVDPLAQAPSPDENHGFEDVNLGSEDETAEMDLVTGNFGAISKGSEFGSFDFGIVKKADNTDCKRMSNLNNAEQPPTWKKDKGIAFGPRGQPPTVPLPPGPPSSFVRADFRESRDNSTTFGTLSQSSSYGDTRNLLELSQQILALREAEAAKVKASASPSRRSGNLRLGNKDPNATMGTSIDFLPAVAYTRPEARRDGSGQSSNELSTFRMTRTLPQNPASSLASRKGSEVSGGGSVKDAKALDRDISLEMKRIDEMGRSTSNSIVVFNENGLSHEDSRASLADLGPGGLQSQSSRELSSHRSSISDDSGHGASDKGSFSEQAGVARSRPRISAVQGRAEVTSKGSFAASLPSTNSSGSEQDDNVPNRFHIDEEDGDWETIGGSGVLSRSGTALGFRHPTTGSSLADYSDRASSPEHGPSPKSYATSLPRHPADERYEHVYRVHETTPDGNPMLLPAYNFKFNGGAGFPSRNALTPPAPANLSASNPYRHPMPLGEDHVHPFKSSPPVVMSSARTLPRAYLRDDSPDEQSPNMLDSSEAAAYDRQVLFPRSYGAAAPTYSVHDSPPAAEHAARGRREQFGDYLDMDSSIPSSAWMDAFCESSEDIEPDVPGANGSFAKVTTLGPNANITGTPDGTGMRQVGSSLADRSSPGMNWSSSPQGHKTSPVERVLGLRQQRYELPSSPPAAHLSSSSGHAKAQPGVLYEQIRAHREQLAAEGLLPRAFTPPTPRPISGPLRPNSLMDPRASALDVTGSSGWNTSAFQAPFYLNPTPPLPPPTDAEKAIGFDYRLHRHPRENSSADTAIWKRKQNLSRAILALCFFFPPMLLLLGYGMLDALMSSLTSGSITHVGNVEKKIALWVGWALAAGAVIGIVAGMIVVGLGN